MAWVRHRTSNEILESVLLLVTKYFCDYTANRDILTSDRNGSKKVIQTPKCLNVKLQTWVSLRKCGLNEMSQVFEKGWYVWNYDSSINSLDLQTLVSLYASIVRMFSNICKFLKSFSPLLNLKLLWLRTVLFKFNQ